MPGIIIDEPSENEGLMGTIKGLLHNKLIMIGIVIALIFIAVAVGIIFTAPAPIPEPIQAPVMDYPNITFEVVTAPDSGQHYIKIISTGGKQIANITNDLLFSVYPPNKPWYLQRSGVTIKEAQLFGASSNQLFFYLGIDNGFYISSSPPRYSEYVDFLQGNWELHIDDRVKLASMYVFKFSVPKSKLLIANNDTAINNLMLTVSPGDTIFVLNNNGIYRERIIVSAPIRLIGINKPTIDGGGVDSVIYINSSNVEINNFILKNSGGMNEVDAGVKIDYGTGTKNVKVLNNDISRCSNGIFGYRVENVTISNNIVTSNDHDGIRLVESTKNTISQNSASFNEYGIHLISNSDRNVVSTNTVGNNIKYGIEIEDFLHLSNTCEYNVKTDSAEKISCSGEVFDRNTTRGATPTPTPIPTYEDWDTWSKCRPDEPKCSDSK